MGGLTESTMTNWTGLLGWCFGPGISRDGFLRVTLSVRSFTLIGGRARVCVEMTEAVLMRYVNGKYLRESEYIPPKISRGYADHTWTTTKDAASGRLRLVVYPPDRDIAWSLLFQETLDRTLTQDIPKIVQSIENSTGLMGKEIIEAEQRAKARRRDLEQQQARWKREEDERRIADSIKESREQLAQAIQSWTTVMSIEQFFKGVEERANALPEAERIQVLERLQLAWEFIGTQNPFEFFSSWKTPSERYLPLSKRTSAI